MSHQPDSPAAEPSGLTIATIVADSYRLILGAGLGGALLLVVLAIVVPARFSSTILLVPSSPSAAGSQLGGLASQLGLGDALGAGASPTASAVFLAQLARSDVILSRLLADTVTTGDDPSERTTILELADPPRLLSFGGEDPVALRRVRGVKELKRWVSARSDRETGSTRISVRTNWPAVSLHIAERVATELDRLNIELSTARAAAERGFLEARLTEQQQTLRAAEGHLERFLQTNREYSSSATLTFARERLQREVGLQEQLLTSLAKSLEDARLREVQNTPVVTVVEPAQFPYLADSRNIVQRALLGFLALASVVAVATILLRLLRARATQGDTDAAGLLAALDRVRVLRRRA